MVSTPSFLPSPTQRTHSADSTSSTVGVVSSTDISKDQVFTTTYQLPPAFSSWSRAASVSTTACSSSRSCTRWRGSKESWRGWWWHRCWSTCRRCYRACIAGQESGNDGANWVLLYLPMSYFEPRNSLVTFLCCQWSSSLFCCMLGKFKLISSTEMFIFAFSGLSACMERSQLTKEWTLLHLQSWRTCFQLQVWP